MTQTRRVTDEPRELTVEGLHGLTLVGDEYGDPTGSPVLMLHGGGQNRHAWKGSAAALAVAGYHVVAMDARGHGDSEWSEAHDYDMADFAADVRCVLDRFDRPPAAVGASMGGMSALLAQGSAGHEQLFSSVILVDVTPRMDVTGVNRIVGFMTANPEGFATLEAAAAAIAEHNPHRARPDNVDGLGRVLRERDGRWHWRWDPAFMTSKDDLMAGIDNEAGVQVTAERMDQLADQLHAAARRLTVPTLLVRGAQSDLVSPDAAREFLAEVPHAGYVDVSGAGHMVAGDDNDAFTTAVLDFLHEHVPANTAESANHEARVRAAAAVRRFGHALVNHDGGLEVLGEVAGQLESAAGVLEAGPVRDRLAELLSSERMRAFLAGEEPPIPADGDQVKLPRHGIIGGPANPFGVGATYAREGDEVVGRMVLGAAYEGPPGRAHGGMVSAAVDEVMTALMTTTGSMAFTASLTLDYVGATPLHVPLVFRAWLDSHDGRRLTIRCTGAAAGTPFVEATGLFIEVEPSRFAEGAGLTLPGEDRLG
ncbi:MAG: alpha/beta fold hydrolase [Actinomycetia bacterium]|nr:alpha/beta fold hydrolase [Actinomycetes bacterium]